VSCSRIADSLFDHLYFVIRKSTLATNKDIKEQTKGHPCLESRFTQNLKFANTTTTTTTNNTATKPTTNTSTTSTIAATRVSRDAIGIMSILGVGLQRNRDSIPGRSNKSCLFSKASSLAP
jgi:hypothetical protein